MRMAKEESLPLTWREIPLTMPFSEAQMRSLKVGDVIIVGGTMHMGTRCSHKHL